MSDWVKKSFSLVGKGGYLDKLSEIYPAPASDARSISESEKSRISDAFHSGDKDLLRALLCQERFPLNDPFISFFRQCPGEIEESPKTVARICQNLRRIGLNGILDGLQKPPEFNRQMGPLFKLWLRKKYKFTEDKDAFKRNKKGIIFLGQGEEGLREFANSIGCGLTKRPDFVAKNRDRYAIGEAKFLGSEGGNQNRAFEDAISLASKSYKNAVTVAILDGIIWAPNSGQMAKMLHNFSGNALTALLLDKFLSSL